MTKRVSWRAALRAGLIGFAMTATAATTLTGAATPARADVVMSQSNDPSVQLSRNLDGLLGRQTAAIEPDAGIDLNKVLRQRAKTSRGSKPQIAYSRSFLAGLPKAKGDAQWECLTEALYFEARGEGVEGIFAVAEVILNRVDSSRFPTTVCGVVNQGTGRKYQCQFSYTCDGLAEAVHEPRAWDMVGKVARLMLDGGERKLTQGATFYHTKAVSPNWSRVFDRTATIGAHHFYSNG